jgi:translation initiation factor 1
VPPSGRVVYSSERGRLCPRCGWPQDDCRCAKTLAAGAASVPDTLTARLRLENRASGKHVTVVDGLPDNRAYVGALCRELKRACGTGGAVDENKIELQGDQRERLRNLLAKKGLRVKG